MIQTLPLRFGCYEIHVDRGCVVLDGTEHFLRYQSFQVLLYLLDNPNRVVTKEEFQAKVWQDVAVTDNALVQCIAEIRRVFHDDARAPSIIKTIPKIGYRLVAPAYEPVAEPLPEIQPVPALPSSCELSPQPGDFHSNPFVSYSRTSLALACCLVIFFTAAVGMLAVRSRTVTHSTVHAAEAIGVRTVLVKKFHNGTGNTDLNWLSDALPEMLVNSINHVPQVDAALAGSQLGLLADSSASGKHVPATVITGNIGLAGDDLVLEFTTKDQNDRILSTDRATITRGELPLEANLFASQVVSRLGIPAAESEPALDNISTSNAEAFRYYRLGVEKAQQFETEQAIDVLKKAVSLDPGFAMAYARIGYAYAVTNFASEDGRPYLDKAWALSEHLPEKQRLYVAAWRAISKRQFEEAITLLHTLTGRFPRDAEAYVELANLQRAQELPKEAEETLKVGLAYNPQSKYLYNSLAGTELSLRQYTKALAAARRYVELAPNESNARDTMGMVYQQAGYPYQAIAEYSAALLLDPDFEAATVHMGDAYYQLHRLPEATEYYKRYIAIVNTDPARAIGYGDLATVYREAGQWEKAKWAATEEHRHNPQAVWDLLVLAIQGRQKDEARRLEKELVQGGAPSQERGTPGDLRTVAYQRGWLALQRGDKEAAIASFQEAMRHLPPTSGIHFHEDCLSLADQDIKVQQQAKTEDHHLRSAPPQSNYPAG